MDSQPLTPILLFAVGCLWAVTFWLLQRKDLAQEKQIADLTKRHEEDVKLLFRKHDEDAKRLQDLELDIAKKHYVKDELDRRFVGLEQALTSGFDKFSAKFDSRFDQLNNALIHHMHTEGGGQ